jgi:hypothetical protein
MVEERVSAMFPARTPAAHITSAASIVEYRKMFMDRGV